MPDCKECGTTITAVEKGKPRTFCNEKCCKVWFNRVGNFVKNESSGFPQDPEEFRKLKQGLEERGWRVARAQESGRRTFSQGRCSREAAQKIVDLLRNDPGARAKFAEIGGTKWMEGIA